MKQQSCESISVGRSSRHNKNSPLQVFMEACALKSIVSSAEKYLMESDLFHTIQVGFVVVDNNYRENDQKIVHIVVGTRCVNLYKQRCSNQSCKIQELLFFLQVQYVDFETGSDRTRWYFLAPPGHSLDPFPPPSLHKSSGLARAQVFIPV